MWLRTVSLLRWSIAAICSVDAPSARSCSTSFWRAVSSGIRTAGSRRLAEGQHGNAEDGVAVVAVLGMRHRADLGTAPASRRPS